MGNPTMVNVDRTAVEGTVSSVPERKPGARRNQTAAVRRNVSSTVRRSNTAVSRPRSSR